MRIVNEKTSCPCDFCESQHSDVRLVGEQKCFGNYDLVLYLCSSCVDQLKRELPQEEIELHHVGCDRAMMGYDK